MENNNLNICRKLVFCQIKTHKKISILSVLTVFLISMVYTLLFQFQSGEEQAYHLKYQKEFGSKSQIVYRNLTKEQADLLEEQENIKNLVRLQPAGYFGGEILEYRQPFLAAEDSGYAESVFAMPETGRMPQKAGEIALDTITLDSLGLPHELGTVFTAEWTKWGEEETQKTEFTLCGFWKGEVIQGEAYAWISEDMAEALVPGYRETQAGNQIVGMDIFNPRSLSKRADLMAEAAGISREQLQINADHYEQNIEKIKEKLSSYLIFICFAFAAGFLMLHSIFLISRQEREENLASMKSLGMTPRQTLYFSMGHMLWVCAAGIPLGCLAGGILFQGVGNTLLEVLTKSNPQLSGFSGFSVLKGGILGILTAGIAVLYDYRKLFFLTPVQILEHGSSRRGKRKSWKQVSLLRMAWVSVREGKGGFLVSVLLLFLASLLLCGTYIRYISYDADYYLEEMAVSDYTIADPSCSSEIQRYNEGAGDLKKELSQKLQGLPGVEDFGESLSHEVELTADETLYQTITRFYHGPCEWDETMSRKESMAGDFAWTEGFEKFEKEKTYTSVLYGTEGYALDFMTMPHYVLDGTFDAEKYASGDYVIAVGASAEAWISAAPAGSRIDIGDKTFTVLMTVQDPGLFLRGRNSKDTAFSLNYLMPPQALRALFPDIPVRQINFNLPKEYRKAVEEVLKPYEEQGEIFVERRTERVREFSRDTFVAISVQLVIGLFLLLIAVLNYGNVMLSRMILRKKSFALYQGLGMSASGVRRMVLYEGLFYSIGSMLSVFPAVALFLQYIMPKYYESDAAYVHSIDWAVSYEFSVLPLLFIGILLLFLSVFLPQACLTGMEKESITERLRSPE